MNESLEMKRSYSLFEWYSYNTHYKILVSEVEIIPSLRSVRTWLSFMQVLLSLKGEWITETAISQTSYNVDNWNEATLATTSSQVFMSLFIFFSNLTMKSDANICLAVLQFSSFISHRPQNVIQLRITSICRKCYDRQGH